MTKVSPVLAVVLVVGLVAPASFGGVALLETDAVSQSPSPGVSENTTRVLRLDEIQAAGFGEPRVVVLDATSVQQADLDTAFSVAAVERRLEDAPNATARRRVVANYTERAAREVASLQARERELRRAYRNGELSAQAYAQEMAVLHAEAEALAGFIGGRGATPPNLYTYASQYHGLDDRPAGLYESLQYLQGPIRAEMAKAVLGEREPIRVFVAGGPNGFAFARIRPDGVYVRSAYRADNIDTNQSTAGGVELLLRVSPELYPWASDAGSLSGSPIPQYGTSRMTIHHSQGRVDALVDETTAQIYYEVQHKRLAVVPTNERINRTKAGTRVVVSESYPGGPLKVRVLNVSGGNTTGMVGTPVTVNGTTKQTGADGVGWFISPHGDYTIRTAANNTRFQFNVTSQ